MNVYLSHTREDAGLARHLAEELTLRGFSVWDPEEEITPGDNWAKKIGKALDAAELMVILLTPRAADSDWVSREFDYALGSRKYKDRVFTVFVGPLATAVREVPWILRKLPFRQVGTAKGLAGVAQDIQVLYSGTRQGHTNA